MIRQDMRATERGSKSGPIVQPRPRKPRERLAWLLEFANREGSIRALPDEELQQLRLEVLGFCERTMTSGSTHTLSAARLSKLSGEVAHGIRALIRRREPWLPRIGSMTLYLNLNGGRAIRQYIAEHLDGFLMEAHELIAAEAKRLRQCVRKDCRKVFVANKRQVFCSLACSQDERTERFLDRHSEQELSERRHSHYVAWVKRTKGPAVAKRIRRRQANRVSSGEQI
jgi:hypothetical protein